MPTRKTSENGRRFITEFEGEVLKVYKDPVGLPTVGVGHLVKDDEHDDYPLGKKITQAESQALLQLDLARFEQAVNNLVKVPISQNQFDALISLAFNIGIGNFQNSSVLRKLNQNLPQAAADSFRFWNKATDKNGKKVVLKGLTRRRDAERSLFLLKDSQTSAAVVESSEPLLATPSTQNPSAIGSSPISPPQQPNPEPKGDLPSVPAIQVSKNGLEARRAAVTGAVVSGLTVIGGWISNNLNAAGIIAICVTALCLAIIFRGTITDVIRMWTGADPDKNNVT